MKRSSKKALVLASVLHGCFFVLLFVGGFQKCTKEEEPPMVMTLFSAPSFDAPMENPAPSVQEVPLLTPVVEPIFQPTESQPLPDVPKFQPPPPEPVREEPPKPTMVEEVAKPPVVEKKEPPPMDYDVFLKQRGGSIPDPKPKQQSKPRRVEAPSIDISDIQRDITRKVSSTSNNNTRPAVSASQWEDYTSRLYSALYAAWQKPSIVTDGSLVARVEFTLSGNGTITGVRIIQSSGNSAMDQSILAAFKRVGNAGPTPDKGSHTYTVPFRLK